MTATAYERKIAERFAEFLSKRDRAPCTVTPADNPPDFFLTIGPKTTWLELSDIYLSNEEAKFLCRPEEQRFSFECSVDQLALRLLKKLDQKLSKLSYRQVAERFGKGILLLTCQHCVFGKVDLAQIQEGLISYAPSADQQFFTVAYFEYQLPGETRDYMVVYPASHER